MLRSKERKDEARESGVLFGSGLVGGEGLMGVAFCAVVFWHKYTNRPGDYPLQSGTDWTSQSWLPIALAGLVFVGMIAFFARQCLSAARADADPDEQ